MKFFNSAVPNPSDSAISRALDLRPSKLLCICLDNSKRPLSLVAYSAPKNTAPSSRSKSYFLISPAPSVPLRPLPTVSVPPNAPKAAAIPITTAAGPARVPSMLVTGLAAAAAAAAPCATVPVIPTIVCIEAKAAVPNVLTILVTPEKADAKLVPNKEVAALPPAPPARLPKASVAARAPEGIKIPAIVFPIEPRIGCRMIFKGCSSADFRYSRSLAAASLPLPVSESNS